MTEGDVTRFNPDENVLATFWGYMGIASALCFSNVGAAYGTAVAGKGILVMGIANPKKIIKAVIPVIMAGILGIYGLITAVVLNQSIKYDKDNPTSPNSYFPFYGWKHFAAGLSCGICALGAGISIGIAGEAGVKALGMEDRTFVGMMLIMIFSEALGLYGLIISLILSTKS